MSSPALNLTDTIAAPASAPGPAARAILRISGDAAPKLVRRIFHPHAPAAWEAARVAARHAGTVTLVYPAVYFPAAAYLWPTSRSYTGQPSVELHLPGSPPLVEATLSALYAAGVRPARAGEFTLRAFLAGRIDLVQAEAVLGVIDAEDHHELDAALRQLAGGVSNRLAALRHDLLTLLADLEAGLDFVEEDITFLHPDELTERLTAAHTLVTRLAADTVGRWRDAERPQVVLAGLPNAGKSTLFNALLKSDAALVSPVAGTTRDWLAADSTLGGVAVTLTDTAGWEAATDQLSHAAARGRSAQLAAADLILWCSALDASPTEVAQEAARWSELAEYWGKTLRVVTKCDLASGGPKPPEVLARDAPSKTDAPHAPVRVSAATGSGLTELQQIVAAALSANRAGSRHLIGSTAARGHHSLLETGEALANAIAAVPLGDELVAAELRAALDGLGAILGLVQTNDLLDLIFSRFCIGK